MPEKYQILQPLALHVILVCNVVQVMGDTARPMESLLAEVAFVDTVGIVQQR
jgi:hypothetical protein